MPPSSGQKKVEAVVPNAGRHLTDSIASCPSTVLTDIPLYQVSVFLTV
jgi:hypothetical protein